MRVWLSIRLKETKTLREISRRFCFTENLYTFYFWLNIIYKYIGKKETGKKEHLNQRKQGYKTNNSTHIKVHTINYTIAKIHADSDWKSRVRRYWMQTVRDQVTASCQMGGGWKGPLGGGGEMQTTLVMMLKDQDAKFMTWPTVEAWWDFGINYRGRYLLHNLFYY